MRPWIAVLFLVTGCASTPTVPAGPTVGETDVLTADTRFLEGCYDCLLEARQIYERIATTPVRASVIVRLFEVNVLLGMREAELALDPTASFARADALIPELPSAVDAAVMLEIARGTPADALGTPRSEQRLLAADSRALAKRSDELDTRLAAAQVSLAFRQYLATAVACVAAATGTRSSNTPGPAADAPPLLKYRMSLCPAFRPDPLGEVADQVPLFVEAGLYRARAPTFQTTAADLRNKRTWLAAAYRRFPDSASAAYAFGAMYQSAGDCRSAITYYDAALVLKPAHETAGLQRIVCLSVVSDHAEAIASATRFIDARYDNVSEAYYWRAWNHHRLKNLPDARADIDRSLSMAMTAPSFALGGYIKYEQRELDLADFDLVAALKMDRTQCLAQWHLGLTAFARENWTGVGDAFALASICYKSEADQNATRLEEIRASDLDADFKAVQITSLEPIILEDRAQEQAAYLNAANGFVRSNRHPLALAMLDRVPADSSHAAAARELRTYLDKFAAP